MKPPEEVRRSLVKQWVSKAEKDFGLARHLIEGGGLYPEAIGFSCQQAIEKYLKAFLPRHEIEFPKTHNLVDLRLLAGRADEGLSGELAEITVLNPYGVEYRYPNDAPARGAILRRLRDRI